MFLFSKAAFFGARCGNFRGPEPGWDARGSRGEQQAGGILRAVCSRMGRSLTCNSKSEAL